MGLGETVLAVGAGERPASFEQFSAAIDPAWIAAALAATGTASVRRRKLPAERVVWLVTGLRLVALSVLRHHLVAAAALGPYRTSEITLATPLWAAVPDRALVIFDRGFCSYALFHALAEPARHRHWLVRAKMGRTALKAQAV